jgi:PTS system mannose-specific IID component
MTVGFVRAFCRLFVVQGAWNYERMTGVGMGYAAEPLLEDLQSMDPARHAEAAVRSAEYFNSHPYLAGAALGALVRAEYDQVPGAQISRLRAALPSPLGALGDQFFWTGLVPATIGAAILGVVSGHAMGAIILALVGYSAVRIATGIWALRIGLANGARVGAALAASWLPRFAPAVGLAAGLLVGMALPLAASWLLDSHSASEVGVAAATTLIALVSVWRLGPTVTSIRFGLVVIGLAALLAWGAR